MAIAYRRGKKRSFFKKSITESERQVFKEALVDLGLGLENRMKTDANFLSGGQRQALTLAMQPWFVQKSCFWMNTQQP